MVLEAANAMAKNTFELSAIPESLGKGSSGEASESFPQFLYTGKLLHSVKTGLFRDASGTCSYRASNEEYGKQCSATSGAL